MSGCNFQQCQPGNDLTAANFISEIQRFLAAKRWVKVKDHLFIWKKLPLKWRAKPHFRHIAVFIQMNVWMKPFYHWTVNSNANLQYLKNIPWTSVEEHRCLRVQNKRHNLWLIGPTYYRLQKPSLNKFKIWAIIFQVRRYRFNVNLGDLDLPRHPSGVTAKTSSRN